LTEPSTGIPCNYVEQNIIWHGRLQADAEPVNITGASLEAIEAQINSTMPGNWTWEEVAPINDISSIDDIGGDNSVQRNIQSEVNTVILPLRRLYNPEAPYSNLLIVAQNGIDGINCDAGGVGATNVRPIEDGIAYLRGIPGLCVVPRGPYVCSRVSCSWNSGIWLCNDKRETLRVPCAKIGDYAQRVKDECWFNGTPNTPFFTPMVRGQIFDTEDWNIPLGRTPDHC